MFILQIGAEALHPSIDILRSTCRRDNAVPLHGIMGATGLLPAVFNDVCTNFCPQFLSQLTPRIPGTFDLKSRVWDYIVANVIHKAYVAKAAALICVFPFQEWPIDALAVTPAHCLLPEKVVPIGLSHMYDT